MPLRIVILGLSITSSWGNGHASTYRGLVRELCARGHDVLFLERDVPWFGRNRDLAVPLFGRTELYLSLADLKNRFSGEVRGADLVIVGSSIPEGIGVGEWAVRLARGVTAFYDFNPPVTGARLNSGSLEYLTNDLISRFHLYLSFTGGPWLERIRRQFGPALVRPLYGSFDPTLHFPEPHSYEWDLGFLGTYAADRQPRLDGLLFEAARRWKSSRMVVAGSQYPTGMVWPGNVTHIEHLPPDAHRRFYSSQRFTLNVTRAAMAQAGYSPGIRLFEAAACAVPVITDEWEGLEEFFAIGEEILVAQTADDLLPFLHDLSPRERLAIGRRARQRVLTKHTAAHRAMELERYLEELNRPVNPPQTRRMGEMLARTSPSVELEQPGIHPEVAALGPWFQNLHLPDGTQTAPNHPWGDYPSTKWRQLADHLPADLHGWTVLDVGCNAGFHSFKLAERGALVTGIDDDPRHLEQARWAAESFRLTYQVDFKRRQVYDLAQLEESYDLILFMGMFNRLRYPLLGLDILARKVKRLLVFQALTLPGEDPGPTGDGHQPSRSAMREPGWPKMAFLERNLVNDPVNWWMPNAAGIESMLRSAGLRLVSRPMPETYICQPDLNNSGYLQEWDESELLSATGQPWRQTTGKLRPQKWGR